MNVFKINHFFNLAIVTVNRLYAEIFSLQIKKFKMQILLAKYRFRLYYDYTIAQCIIYTSHSDKLGAMISLFKVLIRLIVIVWEDVK